MSTIEESASKYADTNVDFGESRVVGLFVDDIKAMVKKAYITGAQSIQDIRIKELQREIQKQELQAGQPLIK